MSSNAAEGEVRSHEEKRFAAMVAGDLDTLGKVLADDLVYTHSSGSVDTKASLIDAIQAKRSNYQKIEAVEQNIRVYGSSAVVTGKARIELGGANARTLNLRFTDVWVKGSSGWQMVTWQSTSLAT